MIYGTGVDITEIGRVQKLLDRQLRFCEKVLTAKERAVFDSLGPRRQAEYAAGRFSAKESYSKAYGTGIGSAVGFQDIEILDNELGKPEITKQPFNGPAWVSISHTETLVMTQVILERGIE